MIIQTSKKVLKKTFPHLHQKWVDRVQNPYKEEITRILNAKDHAFCQEKDFQYLQENYPIQPEYGYSDYQKWARGDERSSFMMKNFESLQKGPQKVLEVGCGDGMCGLLLSTYGHVPTLLDMDDWRDNRVKSLEFVKCSLTEKLPIASNTYDFIYSYNTFEHVFEPPKALDELVRICKPGGIIYLDFGPLYASAWGLHAFRALNMPYPQYLFSKEFYVQKIKEIGRFDIGRQMNVLQPLNQWVVKQYDELFQNCGCEVVAYKKWSHYSYLRVIREYPRAFAGLGLTYEDVTVHALRGTLRKKSA